MPSAIPPGILNIIKMTPFQPQLKLWKQKEFKIWPNPANKKGVVLSQKLLVVENTVSWGVKVANFSLATDGVFLSHIFKQLPQNISKEFGIHVNLFFNTYCCTKVKGHPFIFNTSAMKSTH